MHQKVLSMILVLVMLLGLLSVSAFTVKDTTSSDSADTSYKYNIMFLDCGRKYYSVDSIEKIIDNASAAGFNYIQLAVGNDGLRFLLDDMSLTVNGTKYTSKQVSDAIHAGNETYYNFDVDELTQSEMNTIITYAKTKGMGVIPCVNTPGHMDAILSAANSLTGTNCSYNGSVRTIDVTNTTAVAFTQALLQKYINYFAGKGCQLFNMGADEYANDKYDTGSMGFGNLQSEGNYSYYVKYVNKVAKMIEDAQMTPMAFNDGIYFANNTSSGTFDTDIIICYWSNGWPGYSPMSASNLASKGFRLVNTNGSYYWVLGKSDAQCDANKASDFDKTSFPGDITINTPAGSMFCIWADYPGAESEESVINKTADTIAAFGNTLPVVKKVETVEPKTVTKDNVAVTAPGLTDLTVTEATAPTIDTAAEGKVSAYDVTPATDKGSYAGSGSVSLPVPKGWEASRVRGYIVNGDSSVTTGLTGTTANGKFTFTVPHFSKMGIYELAANAADKTENITVVVGKENTITVDGRNDAGTYTTEDPSIATVKVTGTNAVAESVNYPVADSITTYDQLISSNSTAWKETGYYYKAADGNYYPLLAKRSSSWWFGYTYTYTWGYRDNSGNIQSAGSYQTKNLGDSLSFNVYNKATVPASPAKTTIVFKGLKAGTTKVTIGDTQYIIKVTDEDLSTVTPLTIEYWITNSKMPDANGNTTVSISATKDGVASESGVSVADIVSPTGNKDSRQQEYWQSKLLDKNKENDSTSGKEEQTTENGDDETLSGFAFTKVRYWGGAWQVYTTDWVTVKNTDQLVAYYMEIVKITNKNGAENLHVNAADWGTKGDGTGDWGYTPESNRCSVSVQLVYEDGSTSPSATTAADLKPKTIVYGYWDGGRGLGTMVFNGEDNYQIFKVTAETGDMSSSTSGNTVTVKSFAWDNNEETVWEGAATDSVSIGNPARKPSYDAPYDNLAWNTSAHNKNNAILIRVYVKSIPKAGALTVNYFVQGNADPFYHYGINVVENTKFDPRFDRVEDANAPGKAKLVHNSVTNYDGEQQEVQSDLSKMTEIGAQYRYSDYTFDKATRSEDGKTVNLYYTFKAEKTFVIDFGLPLVIRPVDVQSGFEGVTFTQVDVTQKSTYANITVDGSGNITYTLNQPIDGDDTFGVKYHGYRGAGSGGDVTYTITVIPATSVYYEDSFDSFATFTNADKSNGVDRKPGNGYWTTDGTTKTDAKQALEALHGQKNVYGYDDAYANSSKFSMGSATKVTVDADTSKLGQSPTATFTFKGTGFDVISLTGNHSGTVMYTVKNTETGESRTNIVNTYYGYKCDNGQWVTTNSADPNALYQIPVIKENLPYGTYEVTISVLYGKYFNSTANEWYTFWLDAIRVYDPMGEDKETYTQDNEGYPQYIKLHDAIVGQKADITKAVFVDGGANATLDEYTDYGPNNEVYLTHGQAISFRLTGDLASIASVQIGAKTPNGTGEAAMISVNKQEVKTATEMYYAITNDAKDGQQVTIANDGNGILSLTNLKITYNEPDKSVTLAPLTTADQANAVAQVRALFAAPAEPFQPDRFEASWGRAVRKGDTATLTVKTSEDVDSITVDGQAITTYDTKTERTGWGWWAKTVTYREFTYQVAAEETTDYTICAVNSAGVSSDPIIATLTVRPSVRDWWHGIFDKWF